ncbi:MAG: hypothetical protein R2825_14800 [Saprospiraceae bacterium]
MATRPVKGVCGNGSPSALRKKLAEKAKEQREKGGGGNKELGGANGANEQNGN